MAGFVARSPTMQPLFHAVDLLHSADNTAALIVGESGTGKELIARAIHFGGPSAGAPLCRSIARPSRPIWPSRSFSCTANWTTKNLRASERAVLTSPVLPPRISV